MSVTLETPEVLASADVLVVLLEQEAGKALDPRAVAAFLRVLPRVREEAEGSGKTILAPRGATKSSVFDDIAVAHELRSISDRDHATDPVLALSRRHEGHTKGS